VSEWVSAQPSRVEYTGLRHVNNHALEERVQGLGFMIQGLGLRVQGLACRVQGAGCRVQGAGRRV